MSSGQSARPRSNAVRICLVLAALGAATGAMATLSPPQRFEVTSSNTTIDLNWDVVEDPGVGGYLVYYDVDGAEPPYEGTGAAEGDSPIRVPGADRTSFTLTGLQENTRYCFVVSAYDLQDAPGAPSRPGQGALCDVLNPSAPVGLTGILEHDGVHLTWTGNAEVDAYGTTVLRGTTPDATDSVGFVVLPEVTYFEPRPGYGQTFYYRVRAMDFCGLQSPPSDYVAVAIPDTIPQFTRSDVDASGELNISDPIYNLEYQFNDGPAPPCLKTADDDDSGSIDLADPIYSLNYQFAQGPPPPAPFPGCGTDPTPDTLSCLDFAPCGWHGGDGIAPVPSQGSEVLSLARRPEDSDTLTFTVTLTTGTPLVALEGTINYAAGFLNFVRFERTGYTQGWDLVSARVSPSDGTIRFGAVPDLHLRAPVTPEGEDVVVLVFVDETNQGQFSVGLQKGRFVAQTGPAILPLLDYPSSGVPNPASPPSDPADRVPTLSAPNPYRAGTIIRLAGGTRGQTARVSLFSVTGQRVRDLYNGAIEKAVTSFAWDGRDANGHAARPGLYYVRAMVGERAIREKMLLLP